MHNVIAYLILEVKKHVLTHEEVKEALSINYPLIEKTDEDWEIKQKRVITFTLTERVM